MYVRIRLSITVIKLLNRKNSDYLLGSIRVDTLSNEPLITSVHYIFTEKCSGRQTQKDKVTIDKCKKQLQSSLDLVDFDLMDTSI